MAGNRTFAGYVIGVEGMKEQVVRDAVCHAEVVIGIDRETDARVVFFGDETIREWRDGGLADEPRFISIGYDGSTEQLEYLLVCVRHLKGSCPLLRNSEKANPRNGVMVAYQPEGVERIVQIPETELADGMLRTLHAGRSEPVWHHARTIGRTADGPRKRLSGRLRRRIKAIRHALAEIRSLTTREWEEGFRRDSLPEREVSVWEHIVVCYQRFLSGALELAARKELFKVIVTTTCNGAAYVGQHMETETMSVTRRREVAAFVEGTWPGGGWPPVPPGRAK